MEKKEYLNEENYQKAKKKIIKISLIILIVGVLIGVGLIIIGAVTQNNAKKTNEERYNAAYKESQEKADAANKRLAEIAIEKQTLNNQISTKEYECNSLDIKDPNWFADENKCNNEISALRSKLSDLEMEEFDLENDNYTVYYTPVLSIKYLIFYFIGAGVIGFSILLAGVFYFIAKRREINAFAIQQTMPLAQEGIEKMAPTIGNAAGSIGKEIAKGITEGIKEGNNNENQNN